MVAQNTISITRRFSSRSRWQDIARELRAGNDGYLSVGDEITCKLKNGEDVVFQVAALNPYKENTAILISKDCVVRKSMNDLRNCLDTELYDLLPDDLKEIIVPRTVTNKINRRNVSTTSKLWLPSRTEVFGDNWRTDIGDVHFPIFDTDRSRVKNFNKQYCWWWMRSPWYEDDSTYVCFVSGNGSADSSLASSTSVCAPLCFQIG